MLISVIFAILVHGVTISSIDLLGKTALFLIQAAPLYWAIFAAFFAVAIIARKGAVAMGTSVALSIIMVVFTNKMYSSAQSSALRFSPVIQLQTIAEEVNLTDYGISLCISLLCVAILLAVSIAIFKHEEL